MKTGKITISAVILLFAFLFSSCLTCEYKEYTFKLTGNNKGTLTIKFVNIMSEYDDTEELSQAEQAKADYNELVNNYMNGDEVKNMYPEATFKSSRLFEENGQLCGEAVFEFTDINHVKLFRADEASPFMFYNSSLFSETYSSSNGTMGPEHFPIVIWNNKMKSLELKNTITAPSEKTITLLNIWKKSN